jgi:hypothetical protein
MVAELVVQVQVLQARNVDVLARVTSCHLTTVNLVKGGTHALVQWPLAFLVPSHTLSLSLHAHLHICLLPPCVPRPPQSC